MEKENEILLQNFKIISKKRWIEGINNSTNSVGLTFEKLLKKNPDSMFFPDYYGIEIKCTQRFSKYPILLFSSAFDGPNLYEMNNFLNKFGKTDFKYRDKKTINSKLYSNEKILFNNKFYFKLNVDKNNKKLYVEVYDINNKLIEKQSYIDFSTLKSKLEIKLTNLALVFASKKSVENKSYFRYYKIVFYKLISFERFIDLIEKNIVIVEIECRISRSGSEAGRQRNKNILFKIKKDDLSELFDEVFSYNHDKFYF